MFSCSLKSVEKLNRKISSDGVKNTNLSIGNQQARFWMHKGLLLYTTFFSGITEQYASESKLIIASRDLKIRFNKTMNQLAKSASWLTFVNFFRALALSYQIMQWDIHVLVIHLS